MTAPRRRQEPFRNGPGTPRGDETKPRRCRHRARPAKPASDKDEEATMNPRDAQEVFTHRHVREALEHDSGHRSPTACGLGIDPRTISKYLEGR